MRGLTNIEGIYFVGIGGIGMSALARYFLSQGFVVCGYDRTRSPLTETLVDEGCAVTYEDSIDSLPVLFSVPGENHKVLIVYTPAIPKDSVLLNFFRVESCGKCTPCRIGTKRAYDLLTDISQGKGKLEDLEELLTLNKEMLELSNCGLGQTAGVPLRDMLNYFRAEVEAHIRLGVCPTGVCPMHAS